MNVLVSACLLGVPCRYDGTSVGDCLSDKYPQLTFIKVCPEVLGGLPTPRKSAQISGDRVVTVDGDDVTKEFEEGAKKSLEVALANDCKVAILKAKSPSCGSNLVYDGTFSSKLVAGDGVLAALLKENGIAVFSEENLAEFEKEIK